MLFRSLVYQFDGVAGTAKLFVDASQLGSTGSYSATNLGGATKIGSQYGSGTDYFQGDMARLRGYSEIKSADWVSKDFARGVPQSSLVGAWGPDGQTGRRAGRAGAGAGRPWRRPWPQDAGQTRPSAAMCGTTVPGS